MKKLFYRLLIALVVIACAMPFFMHDRYGRPLMTLADLKMPDLKTPDLPVSLADKLGSDDSRDHAAGGAQNSDDTVTVYRWKDDQGIWHFSDNVNPDGSSEALQVSLASNGGGGSRDESPASGEADPRLPGGDNTSIPILPILHAGETLEQARNVDKVLQQRYQQQEQILAH